MSTIADNLQTLIDCKADMKAAIESKGVTVSGGLSTYADAIREIEGGTSNISSLPKGIKLGWSTVTEFQNLYISSNIDDTSYMFYGCKNLIATPEMDTSNVTNMMSMFYGCERLTAIPEMDTSNVVDMGGMFHGCRKIERIPLLDCGNIGHPSYYNSGNSFVNVFVYCEKLKYLEGFKNFGKYYIRPRIGEFAYTNFTYNSIMNVINNLYDRAAAGEQEYMTLQFCKHHNIGSTQGLVTELSAEDIAIATNKGWVVEIIDDRYTY